MKNTGPTTNQISTTLFAKSFKTLEDVRRINKGYFYYPLDEILFLCISAALSGIDTWVGIETFGIEKLDWLRRFFPYKYGTPSDDVMGKLFAKLETEEFNKCFTQWINSIVKLTEGEVVAIDGKTVRGSGIRGKRKPFHLVSAYASQNKLSLGQMSTEEKSNEITAIPDLLDTLAIKGCTVTIDAMGCQKKIAEKIISKEADYILMLKDNQKELLAQVEKVFEITKISDSNEQLDSGHGRIEKRKCDIITDLRFLDGKEDWKELKTIVRIRSDRHTKQTGKDQSEVRYYISSAIRDAARFNNDVRSHWSIENNLHWCLDVIFNEDKGLKKKGNSASNFNIISKMALAMLEKETSVKASKPNKRIKAALSDRYREKLLKC